MDEDLKKAKKLVKLMRSEGILEIKLPDIELTLSPMALALKPEPIATPQEQAPQLPPQPEFTDMDALLWSAPGVEPMTDEAH